MSAEESLLLGNGAQLALLELDEHGVPAAAYEQAEAAGRFTGDRIFSGNPKLYRAIAALLGRSVPYREIAEICSVSVNTVCAISQREGTPIETLRERIGRLGLDVAALTMEAIRDLLADPEWRRMASPKDLAIIHGIAFTNAQLALGGATARLDIGEKTPAPGHDDYERFVRNVTGTGSSGDNPAQKSALAAPRDQAIDVTATPSPAAESPGT